MTKPRLTGSQHVLPFSELSADAFERLCLWLLRDEGFEDVQHIGAGGNDQGVDLSTRRAGQRWVCQCKRVRHFGPAALKKEIDKIRNRDHAELPDALLFIVTSTISAAARNLARERLRPIRAEFWALSELDERIKRHQRIVAEFFDVTAPASTRDTADEFGFSVPMYLEALERVASRQRIESFWVPLEAHRDGDVGPAVDAESFLNSWATDKDASRLAILGDYGTGKSWLCIRLALFLAERYRSGLGPLPLLLDMRSYRDGMTLGDLLPEVMYRSYGLAASNAYRIDTAIEDGRISLILDGLDEMAREPSARPALVQFERLGLPEQGKTLVTCRTHYFLSGSEQREILQPNTHGLNTHSRQFQILHLRLMGKAQVAQAIHLRAPAGQGKAVASFAEATYNLSELCSRPVFLSLVCESHSALAHMRGSVTAADLYESYLEQWLRRELRSGHIDIAPESIWEFLEDIAVLLFPRDSVWLSATELRGQVQAFAAHIGLRSETVTSLLRKMATSTVLSRSMGDGWSFGHRSFQEFLYARAFFRWEEKTAGQGSFPVLRVPAWQFIAQIVVRRWTLAKAEQWIGERVDRRRDSTLSLTTLRAAAAYWLIHSPSVRARDYRLDGIMLDSVDLRGVDLSGAVMQNADLHRSSLSGARLHGANLRDSDLTDVDFTGADLTGADLIGATYQGASFDGAIGVPDYVTAGSDLSGRRHLLRRILSLD